MSHKTFISVILPLKLEWEPCYYLPDGDVMVGDRVKVMFAGKEYSGVVSATGISPETDLAKIKPIICIETNLERILPEEIELWRRVAEYYMCTIGEVYKAAYPIGKINLEEAHAEALAKAQERKMKLLESMKGKAERIRMRMQKKEELIAKAKDGTKAKVKYQEELGRIKHELEIAEQAIWQVETSADRTSTHLKLTGPISSGGTINGRIDEDTLISSETGGNRISGDALTSSEADGIVWAGCSLDEEEGIRLSTAQEVAYGSIKGAFAKGKPVLLRGVTGSGKTEIYIKLAQEAIRSGRNVLYLVPEIALSRQLEERLLEHFGDMLLTFHSGETATSRRNAAETIRSLKTPPTINLNSTQNGNCTDIQDNCCDEVQESNCIKGNYIVLGTRSSLFLPHHDLGLIIVDEEHDSSYKQDSPAPRYNGRDTALIASVLHKSDIILGSATPSLEELYNCESGKHILVDLKERYHGAEEAEIEIINTIAERRKRGMHGSFSRKLIAHVRATLAEGGQVMILRSRRAWAPAMQCEECGSIPKCPHCNVSLSYHKTGSLTCHYCGYKTEHTGKCAKCNGTLKPLGAGTQKIEEEAAAIFPEATIARLDSDTAKNKSYEKKTIKAFAKGEIDILIGTQMLAKGFDFSKLRLVAVIGADNMLGMQDFRADEKTSQLLEQFKGRCGRRDTKGLFVIQTSQPEHPLYQHLTETGPQSFSTSLLDERKIFGFPPYTRIIEITIRDNYEDRAERMSRKLAEMLNSGSINTGKTVTGPYAPAVDKVADQYIRTIRISLPKDSRLKSGKASINQTVKTFEKEYKYPGHTSINVDPA